MDFSLYSPYDIYMYLLTEERFFVQYQKNPFDNAFVINVFVTA